MKNVLFWLGIISIIGGSPIFGLILLLLSLSMED